MKNFLPHLLRTLALACAFVVCSQSALAQYSETYLEGSSYPQRAALRAERHRINGKENMIYLTIGTSLTSFNSMNVSQAIEYSRQIKGDLFWGVNFSADRGFAKFAYIEYSDYDGFWHDRNTLVHDIYKLDGMIFYRVPVVSDRLYFRVGAGVGLGFHHVDDTDIDDRVLPYINIEMAWVLRITRHFEMKFSPLILFAPSEFAISPVKLGAPTDVVPWITNPGFTITAGCRF